MKLHCFITIWIFLHIYHNIYKPHLRYCCQKMYFLWKSGRNINLEAAAMFKKRHSLVHLFIKSRVSDAIIENDRLEESFGQSPKIDDEEEDDYPEDFRPPQYVRMMINACTFQKNITCNQQVWGVFFNLLLIEFHQVLLHCYCASPSVWCGS